MAVVTREMLPPEERKLLDPATPLRSFVPRIKPVAVDSARVLLAGLATLLIAFGPEPWVRAGVAFAVLTLVYFAAHQDGRRDLALELLRRNRHEAEPLTRQRAAAEGE